jgi:outer membrane biosynthesis protein TonB
MIQQRRKSNSSKVNLTISFIFHGILIMAVFFFAAREGMLGKKLKQLSVTMTKEKKPEPPKEKPREAKVEPPKTEPAPAKMNIPPPRVEAAAAPPPAANLVAPAAAPSAVSLPAFDFSDGAKEVQTISDPNAIYKALVEHTLRSRWNRPEDIADDTYVAEIELSIDSKGRVADSRWLKGSGDKRWDDSVKAVVAQTKTISRTPPKGFPEKFLVRFDVESSRTEPVLQANLR